MLMKFALLTAAVLACSSVASAQTPPQGPPVIITTGEGIVQMAPDRAWVTIAAETRDKNPQAAQTDNAQAMTAVIAQIKSAGVSADAVHTSGYTLQPEFDYVNGRQTLRDYLARNQVDVRVDALDTLGQILAAAVGNGATNVSGIRFDLKNREAAERQALTQAVRDARARADAIASGAGVQIERVLKIEEARRPIVQPVRIAGLAGARGVAAAPIAPPPIESGQIEIQADVTLTAIIK